MTFKGEGPASIPADPLPPPALFIRERKWANTLAADYFAQYGVNWAEYYYRDKAGNKTYLKSQYPIY